MITDWKSLGEVAKQKISDQINAMENIQTPKEVLERKSLSNKKKKMLVNVTNQRREAFRIGSLYSQSSLSLGIGGVKPPPPVKRMLRKSTSQISQAPRVIGKNQSPTPSPERRKT